VPDYLVVLYGIWITGAVAVPINAKLHGREAAFILHNADCAMVFTQAALAEALDQMPQMPELVVMDAAGFADIRAYRRSCHCVTPREGDDLAWLFYTSGTTSPKG
jgi:long-chain acyl-CoA synthetase